MMDSIDVLEEAETLLHLYSGSKKAERAILDFAADLLGLSVEQVKIELQDYRESY